MNSAISPADISSGPCDYGVLTASAQRAAAYVQQISSRRVSPAAEAVRALNQLCGELPEEPASPHDVVDLLDRLASPATMGLGSGRHFGFVNGGVLPSALAADWIVSAWGQNAALRV